MAVIIGAAISGMSLVSARAQTAPADMTPDLQEVLTLSRQNMDDSVITNYIASTGRMYHLSANDIIYLKNQGVSQGVISALLLTGTANTAMQSAPTAPTPPQTPAPPSVPAPSEMPTPDTAIAAPTAPPSVDGSSVAVADAAPATPTMDYFQAQLTPYGNWVNVPAYGLCWQPAVAAGWRPYYDGGHWEYTDAGWYWQSDYPWGDIAFHYGRWTYTTVGWVWVPGYDYAPSWVVWRHDDADGYLGWAPLPPGAVFVNGGWVFRGAPVGMDFNFGLGLSYFTFVGYDHFWEHNYRAFLVPHDRLVFAFGHSAVVGHYGFDHGHVVNFGLAHDHMVTFTHRDFHPVAFGTLRVQEEHHNIEVRHDDIHDFHSGQQPNANGWHQNNGQNNGHGGWGH